MLSNLTTHAINNDATNWHIVKVAGLILVRQRPGTAAGVCFITIEDETGFTNLVVSEKLFEKYLKEILHSKLLMVEGRFQREGQVVHVIVSKCTGLTKLLGKLLQKENEQLPILTSSQIDEKNKLHISLNKNAHGQDEVPKEAFHAGRNLLLPAPTIYKITLFFISINLGR